MERAILHCDLNNFYASVECRDFPHLKGKAVAVCGRQEAVSYTHLDVYKRQRQGMAGIVIRSL